MVGRLPVSGAISRSLTVITIRAAGWRVLGDGTRPPLRLFHPQPQEGAARGGVGGAALRFPTSLSPFPPPAMAASANTRQAKGRPSTGSAGDQGADYDLPGDQTSGRGGAPPQRPPRKILENVPYSHLGRGVKGGWHQGGARTIPPTHRARVALPSRDSDACAPLKRRASLLFSLMDARGGVKLLPRVLQCVVHIGLRTDGVFGTSPQP